MKSILKVTNLKKTFILSKKQMKISKTDSKYKLAVNDLSFEVFPGEIYGLLGPNGAGKTTTLRMMSTLIQADEGDVLVDGVSVKSESEKVRKNIAFLTSELKLEDYFTPNYLFGFFGKLHGLNSEQIAQRKNELFKAFDIESFKEVKVGSLSTGMKQKVSIAIALVHNPNIIIFDEPTNGLDIITAKMVTDYLIELKKQGKTIIISTHIFSLVEKLCDRVGIIIEGKMMAETSVKEVLATTTMENYFFDIYEANGGKTNE